jgi:hypothetical protein
MHNTNYVYIYIYVCVWCFYMYTYKYAFLRHDEAEIIALSHRSVDSWCSKRLSAVARKGPWNRVMIQRNLER